MSLARFSPRAARDLDEHCERIAADNSAAAARVRAAILDYADLIARHPGIGRRITGASVRHAQIRWLVVPPYRNYLVFFQPHADSIMVVRVLHAAQDWTRFFLRTAS
jgi:plasmid stabilization system protein ParE